MWTSHGETDRIIIAGVYENTEMVVRHELLHHLLGQAGHPAEYFVTLCHLTWDSWASAQGSVISGPGGGRAGATPEARLLPRPHPPFHSPTSRARRLQSS